MRREAGRFDYLLWGLWRVLRQISRIHRLQGRCGLLAEIADSHGFHNWLPLVAKEFNYAEFRKGLDFFSKEDTWLVCKGCCKGGGGGPPGCVRDCCIKHKVGVCWECSEFPCNKVKDEAAVIEGARKYRELGRDEWLRQHAEKAKHGFEGHTGKYYQVWISKYPPTQSPDRK